MTSSSFLFCIIRTWGYLRPLLQLSGEHLYYCVFPKQTFMLWPALSASGTFKNTGKSVQKRWYVRHTCSDPHGLRKYLVRGDQCCDYSDPTLGYDWYLDNKVWVRRSFERDTLAY